MGITLNEHQLKGSKRKHKGSTGTQANDKNQMGSSNNKDAKIKSQRIKRNVRGFNLTKEVRQQEEPYTHTHTSDGATTQGDGCKEGKEKGGTEERYEGGEREGE